MPSSGELAHLAKHPEPDSTNLSSYLVEHFDVLRGYVPSTLSKLDLVGMRDGDLAPLVIRKLEHRRTIESEQRAELAKRRAQAAADRLSASPRRGGCVLVDPPLLFRDLLADSSASFIRVQMDEADHFFRRSRLWRVAREVFEKDDLRVWLDAHGLHLRWNGGKGGLNLRSDLLPTRRVQLLTVDLRSACADPARREPEQACGERLEPPAPVEREPEPTLPRITPPTPRRPAARRRWVDFLTFI